MVVRTPKKRLNEILTLSGETLDIDGYPLAVEKGREKPLLNASVAFSRYVLSNVTETENEFLERMAIEIKQVADFKVQKMMCGKSHYLNTSTGPQLTRHLMIADLDNETLSAYSADWIGFRAGLWLWVCFYDTKASNRLTLQSDQAV